MGIRSLRVTFSAVLGLLLVVLAGGGTSATAARSEETPVLSPITATFYEALRTTRYNVSLANPVPAPAVSPVWRWDFTPDPSDPTCNQFTADRGGPTSGGATFEHGDDKGCHHLSPDHNVDIEVVVATGSYTCNARIHGTTTHVGTTPEPCFKTTTPPPPKASAPPTIVKSKKKQWEETAAIEFGLGATAGTNALLWAVVPVPDPVTKGIAVVSLGAAVVNMTFGFYALYKANDPPDSNYKTIAQPVFPRPATVRAVGGVTKQEAAAANALLRNAALIVGNDRAFLTSFERAQGAYAARDGTWDSAQSQAAARYARAEAKLLDQHPRLELALKRAVGAAARSSSRRLSAADARRLPRAQLPASAVALLRSFGLNNAQIASAKARLAKVSPAAAAGPAASKLATSATAKAARSAATLLRSLATALDRR